MTTCTEGPSETCAHLPGAVADYVDVVTGKRGKTLQLLMMVSPPPSDVADWLIAAAIRGATAEKCAALECCPTDAFAPA